MRADIYPLQMLLLTVSGWVHRHQANVISYLVEENPAEVYHGVPPANEAPRFEPRARWPRVAKERRGSRGARLELVLRHVEGRRHLPVVELKQAA